MTVVVGFNAGDFVLFGADARETAPDGSYQDTKEKIQPIPVGLIASSGSVGFGDLVNFLMTKTNQPQHLKDFIERAFTDLTAKATDELRENVYRLTSWVMSYRVAGELILSASHPSRNHVELQVARADFVFLPPEGMADDAANGLTVFLHQKTIELCASGEAVPTKVDRFADLIQFVVEQCAQRSASVAQTFQIGLHDSAGRVRISNLMSSPSEFKWKTGFQDCN